MLMYSLEPILHIFKSFGISDIVHDNDAVRLFVKGLGHGAEAILARRVPHFNHPFLTIFLMLLCHKVQAQCC